MTDQELKPCAHCGGAAENHFDDEFDASVIMCSNCTARVHADTEAEAIAAWNRRADTDLTRKIRVAEEALERIATAQVAFNAHPVGVIETMREWAAEGLAAIRESE